MKNSPAVKISKIKRALKTRLSGKGANTSVSLEWTKSTGKRKSK